MWDWAKDNVTVIEFKINFTQGEGRKYRLALGIILRLTKHVAEIMGFG
jgi:hypothetical protein